MAWTDQRTGARGRPSFRCSSMAALPYRERQRLGYVFFSFSWGSSSRKRLLLLAPGCDHKPSPEHTHPQHSTLAAWEMCNPEPATRSADINTSVPKRTGSPCPLWPLSPFFMARTGLASERVVRTVRQSWQRAVCRSGGQLHTGPETGAGPSTGWRTALLGFSNRDGRQWQPKLARRQSRKPGDGPGSKDERSTALQIAMKRRTPPGVCGCLSGLLAVFVACGAEASLCKTGARSVFGASVLQRGASSGPLACRSSGVPGQQFVQMRKLS